MKRLVLTLMIFGASVTSVPAAEKIYRLGDLEPSTASAEITRSVILPELATLGFREQVNLAVDERVGNAAAFPRLAQELVLSRPDAIIAFGGNAILAARNATSTIPIVTFGADPIQRGVAASLARPGGNVTGVVVLGVELDAKRLDLLHQTVPTARRMAALVSRSDILSSESAMRAVAANNGIELVVFEGDGPRRLPSGIRRDARSRCPGARDHCHALFLPRCSPACPPRIGSWSADDLRICRNRVFRLFARLRPRPPRVTASHGAPGRGNFFGVPLPAICRSNNRPITNWLST